MSEISNKVQISSKVETGSEAERKSVNIHYKNDYLDRDHWKTVIIKGHLDFLEKSIYFLKKIFLGNLYNGIKINIDKNRYELVFRIGPLLQTEFQKKSNELSNSFEKTLLVVIENDKCKEVKYVPSMMI